MITLYLRTRNECAIHAALYAAVVHSENVHTKTNARGRCVARAECMFTSTRVCDTCAFVIAFVIVSAYSSACVPGWT